MSNLDKATLIYNSWRKLFRKFWPKKVTIDMIVEDAWIGKWTFYNYYKNKEDLYEKINSDIFDFAKKSKYKLVEEFPNPKERLIISFLNGLEFFCNKEGIIWNLVYWNTDYYLWKIDQEYLEEKHREIVSVLFSDINETIFENDIELMDFCRNLFWIYKHSIQIRDTFITEIEYKDFMTQLAYFFVEGIFSKKFKKIKEINYWDYCEKLKKIDNNLSFISKY